MTDVVVLEARLASLKLARDSGVLTVKHQDTLTTYRSLSEIEKIILDIEGEIAAFESPRRRIRYLFQSGKGL